jgi:signal transduction histidine kinase
MLRGEPVAVIMTDQRMPEMSGVEFLRRCIQAQPDAVRLLFTGYADLRAVIGAINEGNVYRYITKPWDPDELQSTIREACERYDLLAERRRLIGELKERNAELQATNLELLRANELKYAFIQVAGHELRTPLTILLGLVQLTARLPGVPEPAADCIRRIETAGTRLQHLVEQLLAMLAAEKFSVPLNRRPTPLAAFLKGAADDVRPFVDLRRQMLVEDWPADLGEINLDAEKMRDSLNQLLLNAIKFTPDGGAITLSARRLGEEAVQIEVIDTGVGIDEAAMARLFEPFFTGFDVSHHSSGSYEYCRKGLGLGLSVVKAFVELHGGVIEAKSAAGKGSTFTVTVPRS